jgi:hypothetical protein
MGRRFSAAAAALFVLFFASPSLAADQKKIDDAIAKAMDRLMADQDPDTGAWRYNEDIEDVKKDPNALGNTALAALALFENGVSPTEPHLRKALKFIRERTPHNEETYGISLVTIALSRIGQRQDLELIRECAKRLVDSQLNTGGWHYKTYRVTREKGATQDKNGLGDLSVTQFAVLALWQAQRARAINAEPALRKVRQRLAWAQTEKGGWAYPGIPDTGDSHTMTTAATYLWLCGSAAQIKKARAAGEQTVPSDTSAKIYQTLQEAAEKYKAGQSKAAQGKGPKEGDKAGEKDYTYPVKAPPELQATNPSPLVGDPVLEKALKRTGEWADQLMGNSGAGYWYYYLWSVQRLGVLLGTEKFGKTDWYKVGAEALVAKQNEDGSFGVSKKAAAAKTAHYKYGPDTSFALLFLRKANLGSDVTKLLNPDPSTPFRVVETDKKFKDLPEAIKEAKANETIEITGDGPFLTSNLVLDKPLKIKAVPGYEPRLQWARPKDKNGFEIDFSLAPESKIMIVAKLAAKEEKPGEVQFEGCRFQMDPPESKEFALVRCEGRPMAFCNCSFTTASKKGCTLFEVVDCPRILVRNSYAFGFASVFNAVSHKGKTERGVRMGLQDCVLYGPNLLTGSGDGAIAFFMIQSTVHCKTGIMAKDLAGALQTTSENNVIRCEELFTDMGPGERGWSGHKNLYDVGSWVANAVDSKALKITKLDQWKQFFETEEKESAANPAPFMVYRQQVSTFRHDLNPRDWSLKEEQLKRLIRVRADEQLGAAEMYLGPGDPFLQFREVGDYLAWGKISQPSKRSEE